MASLNSLLLDIIPGGGPQSLMYDNLSTVPGSSRLHSATIFRVKNNPETAYSGSDRFLRADSEFGVEIEIL